ncbi:MAG: hypothetical protein WCT36_05565 [Candidatus Gracilibacteria bacterium]
MFKENRIIFQQIERAPSGVVAESRNAASKVTQGLDARREAVDSETLAMQSAEEVEALSLNTKMTLDRKLEDLKKIKQRLVQFKDKINSSKLNGDKGDKDRVVGALGKMDRTILAIDMEMQKIDNKKRGMHVEEGPVIPMLESDSLGLYLLAFDERPDEYTKNCDTSGDKGVCDWSEVDDPFLVKDKFILRVFNNTPGRTGISFLMEKTSNGVITVKTYNWDGKPTNASEISYGDGRSGWVTALFNKIVHGKIKDKK